MLVLQGAKRAVESLAFHPVGDHLVAAGGYSDLVEYWSLPTRTKLREWAGPYGARQVRFHPSGRYVVCSFATSSPRSDEDFIAVDTTTWKVTPLKKPDSPTYLTISPRGDRVVIYDDQHRPRFVCREATAGGLGKQLWARTLAARAADEDWTADGIDFFPGGESFASLEYRYRDAENRGPRNVVRVRSAATGRLVGEVQCPCARGYDIRASPDGEWVALHSLRMLHLLPRGDPAAWVDVKNPNRKQVTALAFHPTGRYLAVTRNDRTVRLHDRDAGWAVSRTYDWDIGKLKSVAFSADGTLAAAGGEKGAVVVWDVDV